MIQIGKILKKVPIFRMLGKESIDFIVERLKFKTFQANEVICKSGDPGDEMYIIISGETDILIGEPGQEQVVATLGSGDYFGEMALLTGESRSATVRTKDASETFVLYKNDFDVILERFPSISLSMGKIVSQRLRDTLKKAASKKPSSERTGASSGGTAGPSGTLKEMALVDLINFCESNSLTGEMLLKRGNETGIFSFERGVLLNVKLGESKEDEALDTMLGWDEGNFEIKVKPLTLSKKENEEEDITKSIIIVNNSLVVRKVIERAFKGLGYNVSTASNIATTLDSIKGDAPDLVISDIKLADGNGLEFVNQTREIASFPFIFITDNSVKPELEKKLLELGDTALTKTHEVSEIVKLVENSIL